MGVWDNDWDEIEKVLTVKCPVCGALPGQFCFGGSLVFMGIRTLIDTPHNERKELYEREKK